MRPDLTNLISGLTADVVGVLDYLNDMRAVSVDVC
jgi:hypothetical protein